MPNIQFTRIGQPSMRFGTHAPDIADMFLRHPTSFLGPAAADIADDCLSLLDVFAQALAEYERSPDYTIERQSGDVRVRISRAFSHRS